MKKNVGNKMKKCKRVSLILGLMLVGAASVWMVGCKKKNEVHPFVYEENASGGITITGLTDQGNSMSELTIPSELDGKKVTQIGREAFRGVGTIRKLVISDSVQSILENAFLNCTNLEEITFSNDLMEVGTNAVKNTLWEKKQLEEHSEIVVGNILIEVGEVGSEYHIPDDVKYVASGVFYNNESLTKITLPSRLEKIGTYAFAGCKNLSVLEVPSSVLQIGFDAFADVPSVKYAGEATGAPWGATEIQK